MYYRSKSERPMKLLKYKILFSVFEIGKEFFKKTQKTHIIKINTGNFNYNNILFSQNFWHFSFVKETKPI